MCPNTATKIYLFHRSRYISSCDEICQDSHSTCINYCSLTLLIQVSMKWSVSNALLNHLCPCDAILLFKLACNLANIGKFTVLFLNLDYLQSTLQFDNCLIIWSVKGMRLCLQIKTIDHHFLIFLGGKLLFTKLSSGLIIIFIAFGVISVHNKNMERKSSI